MFHDESVGEKKLTLVVVKVFIRKDGVRLKKLLIIVDVLHQSVCLCQSVDQSVGLSVGRSVGKSIDPLIDRPFG